MTPILYGTFTALLFGVVVYLLAESWLHSRRLLAIPSRILVNGIRGKSSITRLIWGALHEEMTTVGKTTGSAARIILPLGHEVAIRRRHGVVNVIEQLGVVKGARLAGAQALVIECMAVMPDLQQLNQERLIRSHIGVISNVREDHLAEMGPTLDDVARSLSRSMPRDGVCVTAERDRLPILLDEAKRRNCTLVYADPDTVTDEEMAPFGYITFKENVAIALAVAHEMVIPRDVALSGMYKANPDPGVLRVDRVAHGGREFDTVNLFAANDPNSTMANIDLLRDRGQLAGALSVVINCRPDRVERNAQMGALIARINPSSVFLIGSPTRSAYSFIAGSHRDLIVDIDGEHHTGGAILDRIATDLPAGDQSLIMIGNIHGRGEHLLEALAGAQSTWSATDDLAVDALTREIFLEGTAA